MTTQPRSRTCLLCAGLLLLAPGLVLAGPNEGGTLILHANPSLVFTSDIENYCGMAALDSCAAAVTSVEWDPEKEAVFHVLAAFPPGSQPRLKGLSFGIEYDPAKFILSSRGSCADFELPDGAWPASGTGTAQTWTTATQTGLLTECYWFAGFAYSEQEGEDSTSVTLIPHPVQHGVFVDDAFPAEVDTIAGYGRLGFGMPGAVICPSSGGDSSEQTQPPGGAWNEGSDGASLTFVELNTSNKAVGSDLAQVIREEYGLQVLVTMAPDGVICRASQVQRELLVNDSRVLGVADQAIPGIPDVTAEDLRPGDPGFSARVWNRVIAPVPSEHETFIPPKFRMGAERNTVLMEEADSTRFGYAGSEKQTSVYMLGDIGVTLILPESIDSSECNPTTYTENWDIWKQNLVYAKATYAFTHLALLSPDAGARFRIDTLIVIPTSVEPVRTPLSMADQTWRKDMMDALGVAPNADMLFRQRTYLNQKRAEHEYEWWFIGYVINDWCDPDHHFEPPDDDFAAISCYFGPSWTSLFVAGGEYNTEYLQNVFAHETCHMFGASDEYCPATHCETPTGYLNVRNRNIINCRSSRLPCMMDSTKLFTLCPYSRAEIGWRDSIPPGGVFDPINHPLSPGSALIGEEDPLAPGDWVDIRIYDAEGRWIKRLDASSGNADGGRVLWDGIRYDGGTATVTAEYQWRKNGTGSWHNFQLSTDVLPPRLDNVHISLGEPSWAPDTLRFRFADSDTHAGRVRAVLSMPGVPGVGSLFAIQDSFLVEPTNGQWISQPLLVPYAGRWTLNLAVWGPGSGNSDSDTLSYVHEAAGVPDAAAYAHRLGLSWGRPNPSSEWVAWEITRDRAGTVDLKVVGVDGRIVREWDSQTIPAGSARIQWDGCDGRGRRQASGKYFLVVVDQNGRRVSSPATLLR